MLDTIKTMLMPEQPELLIVYLLAGFLLSFLQLSEEFGKIREVSFFGKITDNYIILIKRFLLYYILIIHNNIMKKYLNINIQLESLIYLTETYFTLQTVRSYINDSPLREKIEIISDFLKKTSVTSPVRRRRRRTDEKNENS